MPSVKKEQPSKALFPHPNDVAPVTWTQIDQAWKQHQAGERGYTLEKMKARLSRRQSKS